MRSEGERWDPATVCGLHNLQEVLVVGNAAFMPWLTEVCKDVTSIRKPTELAQLARDGEQFDRVIISRETTFTPELIASIGPLLRNESEHSHGLMIAFPSDDGWAIEQATNFYYPEAREWAFDTTFGAVLIAELNGVSWRYYNV